MSVFLDFKYPDKTHYTDSVDSSKLFQGGNKIKSTERFGKYSFNSKSHYNFKKQVRHIEKKQTHSFVPWKVLQEDFGHIKEKNIVPDKDGVIVIKRNGHSRTYSIHKSNKSQRIFPVNGDLIKTFPGKQAYEKICAYYKSDSENFHDFLLDPDTENKR